MFHVSEDRGQMESPLPYKHVICKALGEVVTRKLLHATQKVIYKAVLQKGRQDASLGKSFLNNPGPWSVASEPTRSLGPCCRSSPRTGVHSNWDVF